MTQVTMEQLTSMRAEDPDAIVRAAQARKRRPLLRPNGRLMLVAADHPARGALAVRDDPMAMADRFELLGRLTAALDSPGVDGVLASPDIVEDLLLLGALEEKIVIGSMNRAGLSGAVFEMDDRFTAYDARTLSEMGFDGGKMLTRIDLNDPETPRTLESCARAVSELAELRLMAMIEPFISARVNGALRNDRTTEAVIHSVAIASGLGCTSRHTWLKLPVVDGMESVMRATTLPTLLLGGDPSDDPAITYGRWERALAVPGVCGLVVGRALLYPPDDDVRSAVATVATMVHAWDDVCE